MLEHAKDRKNCGFDNLPMELWKFGGNELKIHLLEPINNIIDKNQMPQEWETGMVINKHKKGSKSKRKNYKNYYTVYSLQVICKHNEKQIK